MVRCVAGRRERFQVENARFDRPQARFRNRCELAPEAVEVLAVKPPGAPLETARIEEMRRSDGAHVDLQRRVAANQGSGGAGVVEVDVREHEVAEVLDLEPTISERLLECSEAARGAAVDECRLVARQEIRRDHAPPAEVEKVDQVCHGWTMTLRAPSTRSVNVRSASA